VAARPRAFVEIERHLRKQCAPLHRLRLGEIDRRKIAAMLAQIETASGPVARNRARSSLSAYFAWAITNGVKDAKISEDGLANALDVRAFKLTNGYRLVTRPIRPILPAAQPANISAPYWMAPAI